MSSLMKACVIFVIILWASAFVGIRVGLRDYSPEGLALLRFIVGSLFMTVVYFRLPSRQRLTLKDSFSMFAIGVIGIACYHLSLNYGELTVSSGMASFIISQSPIITAFMAILFLGEELNIFRMIGFLISIIGVLLITIGQEGGLHWDPGIGYVMIATLAGSVFNIFQKPFYKKYHFIEVSAFVMWGGTLFLLMFLPSLINDLKSASLVSTTSVIYLGFFPTALAYLGWSYVLSNIPASRAVSYLYFMPFIATLLGWIVLKEIPTRLELLGGFVAIAGVWVVNHSYRVLTYSFRAKKNVIGKSGN